MNAAETAPHDEPEPAAPVADARPDLAEVTSWLLEGRFFTIDTGGRVTMWSSGAAAAFGYARRDFADAGFVEILIAQADRAEQAQRVAGLFEGDAAKAAEFTGEITALDAEGGALAAAFAFVPIPISAGYEFNELLTEV